MLVFSTNSSVMKFQVVLCGVSFFLNNRQFRMVLDGTSSFLEYLVNAGVPQGSFLGPSLFLLHINNLMM